MKLHTFPLLTFLLFLWAIDADPSIPSFLKLFGSYKYNTTDNGKITLKRYYSSQHITYKWIEAFLVCKSVGMRLALIQSDDELSNLAAMSRRNSKLFAKKIFVDSNLTVADDVADYDVETSKRNVAEPCYAIQKYRSRKLEIRSEKCYEESNKFLCEHAEVVDRYEETRLSEATLDVKATIFTHMGNFEKTKYYASFKWKAPSNNVPKICQSFGMQMVSPKNQAEYDNLGDLLQNFNDQWNSVAVAGYRSEDNEFDWIVSNNKINYEMNWNHGEPNNKYNSENCIALRNMGLPKMNDISCHAPDQFICEFDESLTDVKIHSQADRATLLKPLINYDIGTIKKDLFISTHSVDWTTAILICKNFGMELLTPSSAIEDDILLRQLETLADVPNTLLVGLTSMGTDDIWYSISSGKILDFDLKWARNTDSLSCLKLTKYDGKFLYEDSTCLNIQSNVICQKVIDITEDVQNITSTSPAP